MAGELALRLDRQTAIPISPEPVRKANLEARNAKLEPKPPSDPGRMEMMSSNAAADGLRLHFGNLRTVAGATGSYYTGVSSYLYFLERMLKEIVAQTKRLAAFNQKKGKNKGASFGLMMMGVEGGDDTGGSLAQTTETPPASPDVAPATPAEATPLEGETAQAEVTDETASSVFGDMNGDGVFDFWDAVFITQMAYGERDGTDAERTAADLNQDGVVDLSDAYLAVLVFTGVLTEDQARTVDLSTILDSNGFYVQQGSSVDIHGNEGVIRVWQHVIGQMSEEDMRRFMDQVLAALKELKKALARSRHARVSHEDEALLDALTTFATDFRLGKYDYNLL